LRTYTAVIEKCPDTGLFVGYIPGMRGAHSQGETLDELNRNLKEVVERFGRGEAGLVPNLSARRVWSWTEHGIARCTQPAELWLFSEDLGLAIPPKEATNNSAPDGEGQVPCHREEHLTYPVRQIARDSA
jgi:hypothetical protein